MAKSELRLKARELRKEGISVNKIASRVGVAKSTASLWVRDIIMSVEQLEQLRHNSIVGSERVRLQNALKQKEKRIRFQKSKEREGIQILSNINEREFFIAGIALYWAEGCKKSREVQFCNSDPTMLKIYINWLDKFFGVTNDRLKCVIGINEAHRCREDVVRKYWQNTLGLSPLQFRKTSFKKAKQRKIYENFDHHYGTLAIRISKPSEVYYKILGLIRGLEINMPG